MPAQGSGCSGEAQPHIPDPRLLLPPQLPPGRFPSCVLKKTCEAKNPQCKRGKESANGFWKRDLDRELRIKLSST